MSEREKQLKEIIKETIVRARVKNCCKFIAKEEHLIRDTVQQINRVLEQPK